MSSPEPVAFGGWSRCYRLGNDQLELIITADVGPRVVSCAAPGGPNLLWLNPAEAGRRGGDSWRNFGGHRLWHAPENPVRTYAPDNDPVEVESVDGELRFTQPVEARTGIRKQMAFSVAAADAQVTVLHRLTNTTLWDVSLAPWALSMMAPGGLAIVPLPPRGRHPEQLLPSSTVTLWPYTDMRDPRWGWGSRYLTLRHDPDRPAPQKAGFFVPDGWIAYLLNGWLLVKTFDVRPDARYPDLGCTAEVFTNGKFLELESLGPVVRLPPGGSVEHRERWHLFGGVPTPESDDDIDAELLPRVQEALAARS